MAERHAHDAHLDNPDVRHETTDVNIRGILLFALGLFVAAVIIHLLVWVLFRFFDSRAVAHAPAVEYPLALGQERVPPEPRLQTNPREDLRDLRDREDAILGSYGWVDKNAGVVRIPITDAMKLTVQRGLPVRQPNPEQQQQQRPQARANEQKP